MTFEDALQVLEVSEAATAGEVRRAYLRLVKRHKPEQDPEGFQRVREAYEIASAGGYFVDLGVVQRAPRPGPAPSPAAVVDPAPNLADAVPAFGDSAPAFGDSAVVVDAATVVTPDVNESATEDVAATSSAEGEASTALAPTADETTAEGEEPPAVGEWFALLNAGEVVRAVPLIERSLDYAARSPSQGMLPGDIILKTIAKLAGVGEAVLANRLTQALQRWVETLPAARDAFSAQGALRWALLQELSRAESRLSSPTYEALGAMIASNESSYKIRLMQQRDTNPRQAMVDYEHLLLTAPTLARTFGPFLNPVTRPLPPDPGRGSSILLLVLGTVLTLNILKVCASTISKEVDRSSSANVTGPVRIDVPSIAKLPETMPAGSVDTERVESATIALGELGLAWEATEVMTGLLVGTCDQAGEAMQRLETASSESPYEVRSNVQRLWAEFIVRCPNDVEKYQH